MNFAFTEEQEAVQQLARQILADKATHERLTAIGKDPDWFDRALWAELAKARLLGLGLPEDAGGSLGLLELCLLLEEVGRAVAPVPVWASLVLGALPIARLGSPEQQARHLRPLLAGDAVLTGALVEPGADDPARPTTTARRDGATWRLDGLKLCVPAAHLAARMVVPAKTGDGQVGLFLVEPRASGVTLARQQTTSGEPQFRVTLAGAAGEALGDPHEGREHVDWLVARAVTGLCVMQAGVTEGALRMTAKYTSTREQFGKPLATFQAVAQRAADAYIDVEAIRWTAWEAAWRLAEGLPAAEAVATAKFWASEAGYRVTYAAQHLHGGMGLDLEYPVHRYYLWAKQIELTLGSATRQLVHLAALARSA